MTYDPGIERVKKSCHLNGVVVLCSVLPSSSILDKQANYGNFVFEYSRYGSRDKAKCLRPGDLGNCATARWLR